jgi:hypothetical protein
MSDAQFRDLSTRLEQKRLRLVDLQAAGKRRTADQLATDLAALDLEAIADCVLDMEPDDRRNLEYLVYRRGGGIDPRD